EPISKSNQEMTQAELEAKIKRLEEEMKAEEMTPSEEIEYELEVCGLKGYLGRAYQWTPQEDSTREDLIAILCPSNQAISRMESYLLSGEKQLGYLDYLAERVAWMMLQEESLKTAQRIIRHYLDREGWNQIELPSPKTATALEWGQAVTVYNFEFQEWLKGQYTHNQADLGFPMEPEPVTEEVKELIETLTLEEWMISVATIYKEWD
ncbi:MAG: hypothetical protein WCD18_01000, partial [Thermosynechococcaceae cyanobacterium]